MPNRSVSRNVLSITGQITVIDPSGASKLTDTVVRTAAEGTAIAQSLLGIDLAQLMGQLAERRNNGSKD
jgi:hypothetical protein